MLKLNHLTGFGSGVSAAGASLPVNGYLAGGRNGTRTTIMDKLVFATSVTAVDTDATLSEERDGMGVSSETQTHGYWSGGHPDPAVDEDSIMKTTFATPVTAAITDVMSTARNAMHGFSAGISHGYFVGGHSTGDSDIVDKITHATDAVAVNTDATLTKERTKPGCTSDSGLGIGYTAGGGTADTVIDKTVHSTDVTTSITDVHTYGGEGKGSHSDTTISAYWTSTNGNTTTNKMSYATNSVSAVTDADSSISRQDGSGVGDGGTAGFGYYISGGITAAISTDRLTHATDTAAAHTDADRTNTGFPNQGRSMADFSVT
ncbi:MAG: hypothetical protein QF535_11320 [Anaerolineales bacterium]|nr:hypothetical protein [Anaerolineales bacterium]